jgi:hypothetical protein
MKTEKIGLHRLLKHIVSTDGIDVELRRDITGAISEEDWWEWA